MFFKILAGLAVLSLMAGCNTTSYDKATVFYDRTKFPQQLERDVGHIEEPVLQHGRCTLQIATPGTNVASTRFCVFALTESFLSVETWNMQTLKYEEFVRINIRTLSSVSLASMFRMKQVQLLEPTRLTAITKNIDEGAWVDTDGTIAIFDYIKNKGIPVSENDGLIKAPTASPGFIPMPIIIRR